MAFFTDAMTVYNYYRDPSTGAERWNRSVISGVQWRHGKRQVSVSGGIATETVVESITIDFMRGYAGNKSYIDPIAYAGLGPTDMIQYWTLNSVGAMDLLVYGIAAQEISADYAISRLRKDYQYVGTVKQISDNRNRSRLKYIKVVLS